MKYPDTQLLRAIAIVLILNSHMDNYYPIHQLATGGAIGNSIFFFLSAFGLSLSQKKIRKTFSAWYASRISRIYPSVWIVIVFLILPIMFQAKSITPNSIMVYLGYFYYPPFWFLQALLIYYLLTFRLLNIEDNRLIILVIAILALIFAPVFMIHSLSQDERWHNYHVFSIIIVIISLSIVVVTKLSFFIDLIGLLQRLSYGVSLLWIEVMALKLFKIFKKEGTD